MKVLLVGVGLSHHIGSFFNRALTELNIPHELFDEWEFFSGLAESIPHKIWRRAFTHPFHYKKFNYALLHKAKRYQPDIILITQGLYVNPNVLKEIKETQNSILINYATDDPFNSKISTFDLIQCIPLYDLYVCTKRNIIKDVIDAGGKTVPFVPFGYDPSVHYFQKKIADADNLRFCSDVLFIGGADQDRIPILRSLLQDRDINLHIYGIYWNRDRFLKKYYRGFAYNDTFRKAHSGTKIGLCLVRKANRDGHTMRTFEIPACGAFLLAERTDEHLEFFDEDREAVFFGDENELTDKVHFYLDHESLRQKIIEASRTRMELNNYTYENRVRTIIGFLR